MNQEVGPLLLELYLEGAHVLGVCRQVQERRRLIDVLNHQDDVLEVEQASVTFGPDSEPRHYATLSVTKSAILAAVPRETQEQNRRRAVPTNMMGRQQTRQKSLALLVPPLAIEGTAHVSAGAGATQSMAIFTKFFSLTGATISIPGHEDRDLDVVLVSRDRVVGMSIGAAPRFADAV